jgi:hypothetical protein
LYCLMNNQNELFDNYLDHNIFTIQYCFSQNLL